MPDASSDPPLGVVQDSNPGAFDSVFLHPKIGDCHPALAQVQKRSFSIFASTKLLDHIFTIAQRERQDGEGGCLVPTRWKDAGVADVHLRAVVRIAPAP